MSAVTRIETQFVAADPQVVLAASTRLDSGGRLAVLPQAGAGWSAAGAGQGQARFTRSLPGARIWLQLHAQPADDPFAGPGTQLELKVRLEGPAAALHRAVAGRICSEFPLAAARLRAGLPETTGGLSAHVLIAGGRGYLGRHLAGDLAARGASVAVLSRGAEPGFPAAQYRWDGVHAGAWQAALHHELPVHLVNLAGQRVDVRPSAANIARLASSRVDSTLALANAVHSSGAQLESWVQSSTTAIFGDAGNALLTESSPVPGLDDPQALAEMTGVAAAWENAFEKGRDTGALAQREYVLRTSLAIHPGAPLLGMLGLLAATGAGGPMGSGRQYFSWISLGDWLALVRALLGFGVPVPAGVVHGAADALPNA